MNRVSRTVESGLAVIAVVGLMLIAGPAGATPVTDPSAVDEGFTFRTLIFILLGVLALIVVSSLGPLSRMAERREELRLEAAENKRKDKAQADSDAAATDGQ